MSLRISLNTIDEYALNESELFVTQHLLRMLESCKMKRGILPQQASFFYNQKFISKRNTKRKNTQKLIPKFFRFWEIQEIVTDESLSIYFKLQQISGKSMIETIPLSLSQNCNLLDSENNPKSYSPSTSISEPTLSSSSSFSWVQVHPQGTSFEVAINSKSLKITQFVIWKKSQKQSKSNSKNTNSLSEIEGLDFVAMEEVFYENKNVDRLISLQSSFKGKENQQQQQQQQQFQYYLIPLLLFHEITENEKMMKQFLLLFPEIASLFGNSHAFVLILKQDIDEQKFSSASFLETKNLLFVEPKSKSKSQLKSKSRIKSKLISKMKLDSNRKYYSVYFVLRFKKSFFPKLISIPALPLHENKSEGKIQIVEENIKSLNMKNKLVTFNSILNLIFSGLYKTNMVQVQPHILPLLTDLENLEISTLSFGDYTFQMILDKGFFTFMAIPQKNSQIEKSSKRTSSSLTSWKPFLPNRKESRNQSKSENGSESESESESQGETRNEKEENSNQEQQYIKLELKKKKTQEKVDQTSKQIAQHEKQLSQLSRKVESNAENQLQQEINEIIKVILPRSQVPDIIDLYQKTTFINFSPEKHESDTSQKQTKTFDLTQEEEQEEKQNSKPQIQFQDCTRKKQQQQEQQEQHWSLFNPSLLQHEMSRNWNTKEYKTKIQHLQKKNQNRIKRIEGIKKQQNQLLLF